MYKNAPESQYYYFIDDDFEFNSGFNDSIIKSIDYMEQNNITKTQPCHIHFNGKSKYFLTENLMLEGSSIKPTIPSNKKI